jgi:hypothetical protein
VYRDGLVTKGIHIEIYSAIMIENEVADRVCALDRERVVIPGIQEPGVFGGQKVASPLISPELEQTAC